MKFQAALVAGCMVGAIAAPSTSDAATNLPATLLVAEVNDLDTNIENQAPLVVPIPSQSASITDPLEGSAQAYAQATGAVYLQGTTTGGGSLVTPGRIISEALIEYYINVYDPNNSSAPLDISAYLNTSATGNGVDSSASGAQLDLFPDSSDTPFVAFASCSLTGTLYTSCLNGASRSGLVVINTTVSVPTNSDILVEEFLNQGSFGPGTATSASADPFFQIDPTFLAQNPADQLEVSDGVGNSPLSAVPEPATWGMMLLGFGVVGYAIRKRPRVRGRRLNFATA